MEQIRHRSRVDPRRTARLAHRLLALRVRATGMGWWSDDTAPRDEPAALGRLFDALQAHGLGRTTLEALQPLRLAGPAELDAVQFGHAEDAVARLLDGMEHMPAPAAEWPALRRILGDEILAEWVGVAPASLRRYAATTRETPQVIAERLHWLAVVVSDLAGAYNAFGIRRWFDRVRTQLDGTRPRDALVGQWRVDDPAVARVRALAAGVSGIEPADAAEASVVSSTAVHAGAPLAA